MRETLIPLHPKSSFERLLFARALIKEQEKEIDGLHLEIQRLKNELTELRADNARKIAEFEKTFKQLREEYPITAKQVNQRKTIKGLELKIKRQKQEIEKLQKELITH